MQLHSPWHKGEQTLHETMGVAQRMREIGPKVIRDYLPEQHRAFYPHLPFVVLGTVDNNGDTWATVRAGQPGFLQSPHPTKLTAAFPYDNADPAEAGLHNGAAVGLLGIELHTRRRNRLNGVIRDRDGKGFTVAVQQSFGNCPQYIWPRNYAFAHDSVPAPAQTYTTFDSPTRALIAKADTLFVASYVGHGEGRQVDVSHRGGPPGFVRVGNEDVLTIPDYPGNRFFNTLGNLVANPKAGLAFIDFATGTLLQITGDTELILNSPEIAATPGAERLWRFHPRRLVLRPAALPLRWVAAAAE